MNENLIRLLSGIVYISILIGAVFISPYTLIALFFIFGWICIGELHKLIGLQSFWSYVILLVFVAFFGVFEAFGILYATEILAVSAALFNLLLIKDLLSQNRQPFYGRQKFLLLVFYLIAATVLIMRIPFQQSGGIYNPNILLGFFILIWSNDTFAYIFGKSFGKRKLLERISPKKTVEGFMGGMLMTVLLGALFYYFTDLYSLKVWLVLGVVTSILGTFGDLVQSKLKRQAGVKDSGRIMPGHGGLLDRLDSILFVAPFLYLFLMFLKDVS